MNIDWPQRKIKDICQLNYGKNLPAEKRVLGDVPVYGSSGIAGSHNQALVSGPGIIIGRKGTVGKVQYSKSSFFPIDTTFFVDQSSTSENLIFLYYFLTLCGLEDMNSDAAVPGLNRNAAHNLKVRVPDLSVQQKIAAILSAYDDLIENNRQRIKLLEEMAQITYEEWFVRLKFPGHENAVFDQETGLPEGWDTTTVGSVLSKIQQRKKIKSKDYLGAGRIPIVDQGKSKIAGYTNDSTAMMSENLPLIVFGDHTRALKLVTFPFARGADGTQILLSNTERLPQYLLYFVVKGVDLSNYHYARHFKFLKDSEICVPTKQVANKFESKIAPMYEVAEVLRQQSSLLSEARDILLPRLMTGIIDIDSVEVPDALLARVQAS